MQKKPQSSVNLKPFSSSLAYTAGSTQVISVIGMLNCYTYTPPAVRMVAWVCFALMAALLFIHLTFSKMATEVNEEGITCESPTALLEPHAVLSIALYLALSSTYSLLSGESALAAAFYIAGVVAILYMAYNYFIVVTDYNNAVNDYREEMVIKEKYSDSLLRRGSSAIKLSVIHNPRKQS